MLDTDAHTPVSGILLSFTLNLAWNLHAAGHSERCSDGGEDGYDEVDNHLPGFFLSCRHNEKI